MAELFEPASMTRRLKDAFATLRVPRHLFKFMYRLFTAHCNAHGDEQPVWEISSGDVRVGVGVVSAGPGGVRERGWGGVRGAAAGKKAGEI